jgi:hypothetical protein
VWGVWWYGWVWWCGGCGGVVGVWGWGGAVGVVVVWWVWGVWVCGGWGVLPLRSNIPRSALCATLDTYNFTFLFFPDNFEVIKVFTFLQNVKKT